MLNTMILASTLVATRTGLSTLHSTLPVLAEEGGVCVCVCVCVCQRWREVFWSGTATAEGSV